MNETTTSLALVKQDNFGNVPCDIYRDGDKVYMTREQIGTALEYANPRMSIANIHNRNKERLDQFSTVIKLSTVTGEKETVVYSLEGVFEICRWANQPKANDFIDFAWRVMKSVLLTGQYIANKYAFPQQELPTVEMTYATTVFFGTVQCDFYRLGDKLYLTRKQICQGLGLAHPERYFSHFNIRHHAELAEHLLYAPVSGLDGTIRNRNLCSHQGIYAICDWSWQTRAQEFKVFVQDIARSQGIKDMAALPSVSTANTFNISPEKRERLHIQRKAQLLKEARLLKNLLTDDTPSTDRQYLTNKIVQLITGESLPSSVQAD